jgi:hypothetical protein
MGSQDSSFLPILYFKFYAAFPMTLHISLYKIADSGILCSLTDRIEFPFSVVSVYLTEDQGELTGIVLRQIILAQLLIVSGVNDSRECVPNHAEMLMTLNSLVNIYHNHDSVILRRN